MLENRITKFLKKCGIKYTEREDGVIVVKPARTLKYNLNEDRRKTVKEAVCVSISEFDAEIGMCKFDFSPLGARCIIIENRDDQGKWSVSETREGMSSPTITGVRTYEQVLSFFIKNFNMDGHDGDIVYEVEYLD
jgi:hypothetical protein